MLPRLMASKPTQIGTPISEPKRTHARNRLPSSCTACGAPLDGRPFCARDGRLAERFDVAERYQVEETLGAGGMALVFAARHKALGKPVAVKVLRHELALSPEHVQRFLREGRLASQLQHENIVSVIDFGHDAALGLPFLVMDRLRGPTLAEVIRDTMPVERAVPILSQLARALLAAHEHGIAHRDLTPRNVVLEESSGRRDVVKLCDFGVSRTIDGDDRVTQTGQMIGTPAYMAPEQIRGDGDQDASVDIYALGVLAHEMLTGQLPFEAPTSVAMIAAKLRHRVEPIASRFPSLRLPRALETIVLRCLEADPKDRPGAAEVAKVLTEISLSTITVLEPADLIGCMIGSYRVTEHLGTGGMGAVYRAEHPAIGTQVAIKVLLPEVAASGELVERFMREARASGAIESPYIPRYFDFGRLSDGRAYAVMEYIEGESVAARIHRCGPLSWNETAELLIQAAHALGEAHALGIVHRDIKPENLFLTRDKNGAQSIKVLDFGIARVATKTGDAAKLTQVGAFIGTPAYAAPEQVFGQAVGPEADVYGLGATAYEMLTGRAPFEGDLSEVFSAKVNALPASACAIHPTLPIAVDRTLARAMARHASDRFSSMAELSESIAAWNALEQLVIVSRPRPPIVLGALVLAGALMLAAIAGLVWITSDEQAPEPPRSASAPVRSREPERAAPPLAIAERPAPTAAPNASRVELGASAREPKDPPHSAREHAHATRAPRRAIRAMPAVRPRLPIARSPQPNRPIIADPFAP